MSSHSFEQYAVLVRYLEMGVYDPLWYTSDELLDIYLGYAIEACVDGICNADMVRIAICEEQAKRVAQLN